MFRPIQQFRLFLNKKPELFRLYRVESLEKLKPLYYRKSPWWARGTYALIAADLVMVTSAFELCWNHWTQIEDVPVEASSPDKSKSGDGPPQTRQEYVLRPAWQRAPLAFSQLFVGVALAAMLIASRSRVIKKLYVVPSSSLVPRTASAPPLTGTTKDKYIYIQAAHHFSGQGYVVPLKDAILERGVDDTEVTILAKGMRGKFWAGLEGAEIEGQKSTLWDVRTALYGAWYGKDGKKILAREGWKSGPASILSGA